MRSGLTPAPEPGSRRDSHAPDGGDRAHRLDEVLDVRPHRREVAAGARGDPAAERGVLERLREVAQRQRRARAAGASSAGPSAPAWMQRRAGDLVDLEHAVERAQVDRDRAVVAGPHVRAHAADDGRAAAEGDRGHALARAPLQQPARPRSRRAGGRRSPVGARSARESRAPRPRRTCRARGRRARGRRSSDLGERRRDRDARRGRASAPRAPPARSTSLERDPQVPGEVGRPWRASCAGVGCWSSKPQPQCLRRRALTARESMRSPLLRMLTGAAAVSLAFGCSVRPARAHQPRTRDPRPRAVGAGADRAAGARTPSSPPPRSTQAADAAIDGLQRARLAQPRRRGRAPGRLPASSEGGIAIELQPLRWALRLVAGDASQSVAALCVTRSADGRWLAGPARAVGVLVGRALGARRGRRGRPRREPRRHARARAGGGVVGVARARCAGEALLRLPHGLVMFVGQAWLAEGADEAVQPDDEHDAFAWWPGDIDDWPAEAGEALPRMARWLTRVSAPAARGRAGPLTLHAPEVDLVHPLVRLPRRCSCAPSPRASPSR